MHKNQHFFELFSQETVLLDEIQSNPGKRYSIRNPRIWVSLDIQEQRKPMRIRKVMTTKGSGRELRPTLHFFWVGLRSTPGRLVLCVP